MYLCIQNRPILHGHRSCCGHQLCLFQRYGEFKWLPQEHCSGPHLLSSDSGSVLASSTRLVEKPSHTSHNLKRSIWERTAETEALRSSVTLCILTVYTDGLLLDLLPDCFISTLSMTELGMIWKFSAQKTEMLTPQQIRPSSWQVIITAVSLCHCNFL